MAYAARKIKLKRVIHIILLTSIMAMGGHILFSISKTVRAENIDTSKITKERLDTFYNTLTEVQLAGKKAAVEFFEKHLHKDLEGVMYVSSRLESAPLQKETVVLTKFEYIRDIRKAYEISTFEELKSGIVSYDIAEDGRSAKVKDRTYIMASVPMEGAKGKSEIFSFRQFINCEKLYALSHEGVLQLKASTCQVEGQMSKVQAL